MAVGALRHVAFFAVFVLVIRKKIVSLQLANREEEMPQDGLNLLFPNGYK